jgi:hypothetical protein
MPPPALTQRHANTGVTRQVSEIAGVKLDRDVNVVAMVDGTALPLPPGVGMYDGNGKVWQGSQASGGSAVRLLSGGRRPGALARVG